MIKTRILVILLFCSVLIGAAVFVGLNLMKGSPASSVVFTVSGIVVDGGTGKALAGVRVSLSDSLGKSSQTLTREGGSYNLQCTSDTYGMNASMDGYITFVKQVMVENDDITVNVTLMPLVLPPPPSGGAAITGKVTEAKTGLPIGGAKVRAGNYSAATGTDGVYSMNVEMGKYTLTVSLGGYETETASVEVSEQKTYSVDLALTPIPTIKVTVDPNSLNTLSGKTSVVKVFVEKTDRTTAAGVSVHLTNRTDGTLVLPAKFDSQTVVTDAFGVATVKWTALLEPLGTEPHEWVCIITASATVDGWQIEGIAYLTVKQPCPNCP